MIDFLKRFLSVIGADPELGKIAPSFVVGKLHIEMDVLQPFSHNIRGTKCRITSTAHLQHIDFAQRLRFFWVPLTACQFTASQPVFLRTGCPQGPVARSWAIRSCRMNSTGRRIARRCYTAGSVPGSCFFFFFSAWWSGSKWPDFSH